MLTSPVLMCALTSAQRLRHSTSTYILVRLQSRESDVSPCFLVLPAGLHLLKGFAAQQS